MCSIESFGFCSMQLGHFVCKTYPMGPYRQNKTNITKWVYRWLIDFILIMFWSFSSWSSLNWCIEKLGFLLYLILLDSSLCSSLSNWISNFQGSSSGNDMLRSVSSAERGRIVPPRTVRNFVLFEQHTLPDIMGGNFGDVLTRWVFLEQFGHFYIILWLWFMFNL